ncbi:hypothetical protein [uncultured Tateyamaria sp.]|uniref:hypothetical protein n=1 Tax=Tateyamaria sp. 1078 TaxID=3417464 RepID=UPI002617F84A|nr:hypothetical protein [uncultured Tateyamaria sp.]
MLPVKNCFHSLMIDGTVSDFSETQQDLFSKTCLEQFYSRPIGQYGYCLGQVFEPYVLAEVAQLSNMRRNTMEKTLPDSSKLFLELRTLVENSASAAIPDITNTASALVSLSRFELAQKLLNRIPNDQMSVRDAFELAMLEFIIANRLDDRPMMARCYDTMQQCLMTDQIPPHRALSAASSAVVWHMKVQFLSDAGYRWFEALGQKLSRDPDKVDAGALSSWYRGIAMVPAARGDRSGTRDYMLAAYAHAQEAIDLRPTYYELNLKKTYFESTLKEHMYVTRDYDAARDVATALLELDPIWSASHGEVAECHAAFANFEAAATSFETAARLGPPYFAHHLFAAGQMWERAANEDRAMEIYNFLHDFEPANSSVIVAGARLAKKTSGTSARSFITALEGLGSLSNEQRAYLDNVA